MLLLQNIILGMIARGDSLQATADRLCLEVEKLLPGIVCSVLTVDRGGLLHPLSAPSLPQEFCEALEGMLIGPAVGSCGTAAYFRVSVAVEDIEHDPRWQKYKELPLPLGLRACWSSPISGEGGTLLGVFAFYYREVRGPNDVERRVVAVSTELFSIALQRHERVVDRERRAMVDALTELPNRAAFDAALNQVPCDIPGSWAIFILDLDNLKVVNDTFGHLAGDALIQTVAQRVSNAMSPDVTFRLGGDEFAVIIQNGEALRDLETAALKLLATLAEPAACDGHMIVPRGTVGGAALAPADEGADTVRQNADFALYHAKESGRGGFVRYWPGIGTKIIHRRTAIRDVNAALKDGRIDAYYQPIVRLDTREIIGLEALCRLRTTGGAIVPAATFQDATSDAHVATALTRRMLSIIALDVRRWLDEGLPLQQVGVNAAAADFHTGKLLDQLRHAFGEHRVPLDHIILEVNENVYVGHRDRAITSEVKALRDAGLRVALDDFGTGFASLTHLMTLPVDILKIDRSFVARLSPQDPSLAIVEGLIDIARKLGIRVVAEGIETEVQASQLCAMGCRLGQGYAFSEARDRDGTTILLRRHLEGVVGGVPLYKPTIATVPVSGPSTAGKRAARHQQFPATGSA